jgi:hypothetical protein
VGMQTATPGLRCRPSHKPCTLVASRAAGTLLTARCAGRRGQAGRTRTGTRPRRAVLGLRRGHRACAGTRLGTTYHARLRRGTVNRAMLHQGGGRRGTGRHAPGGRPGHRAPRGATAALGEREGATPRASAGEGARGGAGPRRAGGTTTALSQAHDGHAKQVAGHGEEMGGRLGGRGKRAHHEDEDDADGRLRTV